MDPLAAYRMAAVSGLRPGGLPSSPGEALSKIIPKDELEKLNPSTLPLKTGVPGSLPLSGGASAGGPQFQGVLSQMVSEVSAKQGAAGAAMNGVMSGSGVPLHQAMIAVEEASISFQLMVEVRNRLLESYQELMRMQV
jgi:flagellar hook-basal body complex protein FliE